VISRTNHSSKQRRKSEFFEEFCLRRIVILTAGPDGGVVGMVDELTPNPEMAKQRLPRKRFLPPLDRFKRYSS
jgi:hypothetical protein